MSYHEFLFVLIAPALLTIVLAFCKVISGILYPRSYYPGSIAAGFARLPWLAVLLPFLLSQIWIAYPYIRFVLSWNR